MNFTNEFINQTRNYKMQNKVLFVHNMHLKTFGKFYSYDPESNKLYRTNFKQHTDYLFCISNKFNYFVIIEYNKDADLIQNKINEVNLIQTNIKLSQYKKFYYPRINEKDIKTKLISFFNSDRDWQFENFIRWMMNYCIIYDKKNLTLKDLEDFRNYLIASYCENLLL